MPLPILEYAPVREFDTGRFVARYLHVLAWLMIAWMIVAPIFFDMLTIDPSPVFLFWAASGLKRRSRATRWWVLILTPVVLGVLALVLLVAIVGGTDDMTLNLGSIRIGHPAIWQVAAVLAAIALVIIVPAAVLMSNRAHRQFGIIPPQG